MGVFVLLQILGSCKVQVETVEPFQKEKNQIMENNRNWTILVYMSADNNLEPEALEDICEMEMSALNTEQVSVLLLVDRSTGYDSSNGNWTGGRLYELKTGRKNSDTSIISKEIECDVLGLKPGVETEINMASNYVLSNVLKFVASSYSADSYGLIMWGHGTGWRNQQEVLGEQEVLNAEAFKAFAFDSSSNEYMSLQQLEQGIKNSGVQLDFLGFDTCFGGELEIFYQLRNCTKYAVGSEGLVLASGWNYEALFNAFNNSNKTVEELCFVTVNQFKNQYAHKTGASICAVKLQEIEKLFCSFENFMEKSVKEISTTEIRDKIINSIFTETMLYSYGNNGSDVYVDTVSLISEISCGLGENSIEVNEAKVEFTESVKRAVVSSWGYDSVEVSPGVYLGVLAESGLLSGRHPSAYIKGKNTEQIDFVTDSNWYVPQKNTGNSFLDKLFYTNNWE